MRRVLRNTQNTDNYLDDVLAHTPDWIRHLAALRYFFECIRRLILPSHHPNVRLEKPRCRFWDTLTEGKIRPRQETVEKILKVPAPRTVKQLRAFLGLASFYRKYVPEFAVIAAMLLSGGARRKN